ncbi:MAG: D-alanyl-D-alanine carboxypeptidase [Candidatus Komeilibacteria bacterium]|jgi:serine-type D-Ala-D-Ala endopeptidase (penicillin-binding protein 7)|nr:D-alanyl-D-alanine carboxypeptidase [Candidatus Komeilibacteria bacterium]
MNLWILISALVFTLGLPSNPAYQLPLISIFANEEGITASFEAVELDDAEIIPHKVDNKSLGVKIAAQSAAAMDKDTGLILWQKNADQVRSIASITKLMTALVFLDNNPGWNTEITLEEQDEINGGTNRILRGEIVTVRDIFYTSLISSDNNATRALVRSTGLEENSFVDQMNAKAKDLDLSNTDFADPTGLKDNNKSTALDILVLARIAFNNQDINDAVSRAVYNFQAISGKNHKITTTNKLFNSFLDIKAGKTGFVNASGYCLVAEVGGVGEQNIISVVLGSDSHDGRFQDLKILSAWVLDNFTWS